MSAQHIFPAIMPASLEELSGLLNTLTGVPVLHLDVMDGKAVPALSWPYAAGGEDDVLLAPLDLFRRLEVHLMVAEPREIGTAFARAGVRGIVAQLESFENEEAARDTLVAWRDVGTLEAGLSIRADTPLSRLEPLVSACDVVQLMSIERIGFQGQPFDTRVFERLASLREAFPDLPIIVDGGVSLDNIPLLLKAGATRFAIGSAIVRAHDPLVAYGRFGEAVAMAAH